MDIHIQPYYKKNTFFMAIPRSSQDLPRSPRAEPIRQEEAVLCPAMTAICWSSWAPHHCRGDEIWLWWIDVWQIMMSRISYIEYTYMSYMYTYMTRYYVCDSDESGRWFMIVTVWYSICEWLLCWIMKIWTFMVDYMVSDMVPIRCEAVRCLVNNEELWWNVTYVG